MDPATSLPDPPRFFTIVGDITQGGTAGELESRAGCARRARRCRGSPSRATMTGSTAARPIARAWARMTTASTSQTCTSSCGNEPARRPAGRVLRGRSRVRRAAKIVVVLGHAPPPDEVADRLAELGVDYLFTGHWHANRRVDHGGLVEWGTETFVMGGIDQSASGYRVVTFEGDTPSVVNHERMIEPHLALVAPHAGSCAAPVTSSCSSRLHSTPRPRRSPRASTAAPRSGSHRPVAGSSAARPRSAPGTHTIDLEAVSPSGRRIANRTAIDVCAPPVMPPRRPRGRRSAAAQNMAAPRPRRSRRRSRSRGSPASARRSRSARR